MKKILVSLSMIALVGAIGVGATSAVFSDTETSTGNRFTAGAIDLTIDSFGLWRNDVAVTDGSLFPFWNARNLTIEKMFNFSDVKPGDWFDRHISVHVTSNPAWVCAYVDVDGTVENENGIIEPEIEAGDTTTTGELAQEMKVFAWVDTNPDGMHEAAERILVGPNTSFFDVFFPIRDAGTATGPLKPIETEMVQMSLCGGTQTLLGGNGDVHCNGSTMDDKSQTDSVMANLSFYAVQERNNPNFKCLDLVEP